MPYKCLFCKIELESIEEFTDVERKRLMCPRCGKKIFWKIPGPVVRKITAR